MSLSGEFNHSGPAVLVRPVEPADAAHWRTLRAALWPDESSHEHQEAVRRFFAEPARLGSMPEAVLIATDGLGKLVGFAELSRRSYAEGCATSPVGFLEGWYVVPEFRERGVGRALLRAAEMWARGLGCREFASDAVADNLISKAAHLALGFEEVMVIRCFRKPLV